ncbi:hypothetical protein JCM8097_002830 [Rhodosporidiobolus ruineniae]
MRTAAAFALGAALYATGVSAAPKYRYMSPNNRVVQPPRLNAVVDVSSAQYNLTDIPGTPNVTAPHPNVWRTLSNDEAASVVELLHDQESLNLTAAADAGSFDNSILQVDLLPPNKADALAFVAGTGPEPERYAVASLSFRANEEPYYEDYIVGPLPLTANSTVEPSVGYSTRDDQKTKIRNYNADEDQVDDFLASEIATCDDIIEELLGAPSANWSWWGIDPLWHQEGRVLYWAGAWGNPDNIFDGQTLLPQGVYVGADITGRDPANWSFLGWIHNGIYYPTTADFRHAYEAGKVEVTTRNGPTNATWFGTDREGAELPYDERPPPMQIAPGGQRFAIDHDAQYVEWMDYTFMYSFKRDTGLRLWNIKYKNESLLYELGLNEALAHYGGNDPVQSGTAYLDTWYGFGPYAFSLIEGYDCPSYAVYSNATFHSNEESRTHKKAICFYETDLGFPMTRHTNGQYASASKNIGFVVKTASTVGNYDYSFTYTFTLDGSLTVEVMASGYIQSAYYAANGEYGYHIHDGLSGSMHTHVLTWKADFDVLSTNNTVGFHNVEAVEKKYDWSNVTRSTQHLVRSELKSEDDAKLDWASNSMVLVYDKTQKNKYGEERAWRIMPAIGSPIKMLFNSTNLGPSQAHAMNNYYVTKRKESEQACAHYSNAAAPYEPVVDFSKFFDGESLEQEDLVLWINQGMHHVPHTGDLGNTVHQTAHAGIVISPHNLLERDPSTQSSQRLRINYNSTSDEHQVTDVLTFGGNVASGLYNLTAVMPNYNDYEGDVAVRKWPYDPLNPFNDTEAIV